MDQVFRQNPKENKDAEISGMQLNIEAIQTMTNISDCITIQQLQQATSQDDHLQQLKVTSSEAGQRTKTRHNKTCEHIGHFKMIWQ